MNFQLQDILSQPALLNEVPDELLQKWITDYPYVSLFQLYQLKRKPNYSEKELQHTAFYFNNREKLYFLLKDKASVLSIPTTEESLASNKDEKLIPDIQPISSDTESTLETTETNIVSLNDLIESNFTETQEINTTPDSASTEISPEEESLIQSATPESVESAENPIITEESKMEIIQTTQDTSAEKKLSIAEQILLEIQQLKEERARKAMVESEEITTPLNNDVASTVEIVTPSTEVTLPEIQIVSKPTISDVISDLVQEENTIIPSNDLPEIQLKSDTEAIDEKSLASEELPTTIPKIEEAVTSSEINTTEINEEENRISESESFEETHIEETIEEHLPFGESFPEPLLVHITLEKPIQKDSSETEDSIPNTEVVPEKQPEPEGKEELIENTSIFIPEVEEDVIETHIEPEVVTDKETLVEAQPLEVELSNSSIVHPVQKPIDEASLKEPHTFIEWLKLLDGNLQIQTTPAPLENNDWIEIPRYEVEQAIAQKQLDNTAEVRIFEPVFEEGEVDLFNEIDEEVTKVASESVSFKQDMMTETLAKIYIKQGKPDKALEIYNTLRLKFPEKSAYFVSLIEKIQNN